MRRKLVWMLFFFGSMLQVNTTAQEVPVWDDPAGDEWPDGFKVTEIRSRLDSNVQRIIYYKASGVNPAPLVISLHTWSADYTQNDPIADFTSDLDWNYIHPDFRGPANRPEACGSDLVVSDLEEAIDFATRTLNVDQKKIYVIGVSGGGYTALVAYLKVNRPIKSFSVWVPISDLENWYWESYGRGNKYAGDLIKISGGKKIPVFSDLHKRSPLYMITGSKIHPESKLAIFTGVHDGYTGSVPVTQSIRFYNALIQEFGAGNEELVSKNEMLNLVTRQCNPDANKNNMIGDRKVHLYCAYKNISLTVFEGTHEMLPEIAISSVEDKK